MITIKNNEQASICSGCGKCCKAYSGCVFPHQLKEVTEESIREMIKKGYCFDWWEGDPREDSYELSRAYFMRPQHKNAIGKITDPSWGGECVFHSDDTGCSLSFDERPLTCQSLVPQLNRHCKLEDEGTNKKGAALAWLPYDEIIEKIIYG